MRRGARRMNDWHREEWWESIDDDAPVRRFAGGIEIVGEKEDAIGDEPTSPSGR